MPWKVYKEGDQYCVHKLNTDGSKGDLVTGGCHADQPAARKHQAALYVNNPSERRSLLSAGLASMEVDAEMFEEEMRRSESTSSSPAMMDGSFPIHEATDFEAVLSEIDRAENPARKAALKKHMLKRALALNLMSAIPAQMRSLGALFEEDKGEYRNAAPMEVELKGRTFEGYAAVFDVPSTLGSETVSESVNRGSFRKALSAGHNVPFLYDHGPHSEAGSGSGIPMATTAAGTLMLAEDTRGLHVKVPELPKEHPEVRMLEEQIDRGEVGGMSWGFVLGSRENFSIELRGDRVHRTILGMERILDVSPTWNPAYDKTMAEIRSMRYGAVTSLMDLEQQFLTGVVPQREGGAPVKDEEDPKKEEHRNVQLSPEEIALQTETRKRKLEMYGLLIPKEFRS